MGLLKTIKKNKKARKIFGKKEIEIIEKHLKGVALTKSETTRLSRDIRKKFEVIKELCDFQKEFNLKKGAEIKFKIQEAKESILDSKYFSKIKKIILFGSAVENKLSLRSDIDIAVEFNKINNKEATKFRAEVSGRVPNQVDVQVFNVLPKKIKKEIVKKGKAIYEQNKR